MRNPIPKELKGWQYWFEHARTREHAELIATRYKKAGFSRVRIILRPGGVLNIPIFLVEGYAPPGYSNKNPTKKRKRKESLKFPLTLFMLAGIGIALWVNRNK